MPIIGQARIQTRMISCWDLPISKKSFISKRLSVGENAMPKYSTKTGKALSVFGSHLKNIITDAAKQKYIISFIIHDTVAGAKYEKK